jgi:hypothetical protein
MLYSRPERHGWLREKCSRRSQNYLYLGLGGDKASQDRASVILG